jgi:hypothetical protein
MPRKREEIELLTLRSGLNEKDIKTICAHHDQELLAKFSTLRKKCCDPFNRHPGKSRTKAVRVVSLDTYKKLVNPPNSIKPGEKVCCDCLIKLSKEEVVVETGATAEVVEEAVTVEKMDVTDESTVETSPEKAYSCVNLDSTLSSLNETPVKLQSLHSWSKRTKGKQKLASATETLKRKLELTYEVPLDSSESDSELSPSDKSDLQLYRKMMNELREKFNNSQSYQERVQILTLSPFTIERTMQEFGATNYLVKKSRAVKKEKGILGQSDKYKGKPLSDELKGDIKQFYEDDEYSRMCPGMKDSVSVRDRDGAPVKHQKRLVLSNLDELFAAWKERSPEKKVGFSTFAALRPKWCVLAGATGTHAVCVCKYHQNPILMAEACLKSSVHDLMKLCVCSNENENCMMGHCKDCPGRDGLMDYLNICEELDDIDEVSYLQWVSTDRTKLVTVTESKADFIENFSTQLLKLTRHSFTAKSQSDYMKQLKSSMKAMEDIILQGDFAENYSYVVQDEIQSFHWENKQATLHPFVAYRRLEDGTLEHRNICVVSDVKEHSTVTVFSFLKVVIRQLQADFPGIKKIHYFTDGCAGQYKNKNNFINLCHHEEDFGLEADWNFFATSHGKSACDGIGGTVKRLLTKASLQRPYSNPILTIEAVMSFCTESIPGIKFFNVIPEEVTRCGTELKERFEEARTIKGTLQFHRLIPVSKSKLNAFKLSAQADQPELVSVSNSVDEELNVAEVAPLLIKKQSYVCCVYDDEAWIGLVQMSMETIQSLSCTHMDQPSCFIGRVLRTHVGLVNRISCVLLKHPLCLFQIECIVSAKLITRE